MKYTRVFDLFTHLSHTRDMINKELDFKERLQPNKLIGDEFEDWFEELTKPLEHVLRSPNPNSIWDFRFMEMAIELKQRRYSFEHFENDGLVITTKKFDNLRKFDGALYLNRFEDNRVYVCDLKSINFPLEKHFYTASTGYKVVNYIIPSYSFLYLPTEQDIIGYLKKEKDSLYQKLYKGGKWMN